MLASMSGPGPQGAPSGSAAETGDPALIGRIIGGTYRIEKFLGGGAMGAVYRARQSALERNVALKVMHRSVAIDPSFVARFHREAKAASRLDHPNSMRVLAFGEEPDGLLYIAMEFLDGRDLYRVIHEDWPLANARIADIVMQALAAAAVAHDMGVIHRDLKPENIMILRSKDDEGADADQIKVCDFGIAKITEKDDEPKPEGNAAGQKLTTQGLVVGTPEYMSPEQARGEKLDARSDLYSMGVILYQLLSGRTPFAGDTALSVVLKHITEAPPPLESIYAGVHKGLAAVAMKALEKDRGARFQTAREMRNALRNALEGRPLPVDSVGRTEATAAVAPLSGGTAAMPGAFVPGAPGSAPGALGPGSTPAMQTGPMGSPASGHLTPLGTAAVAGDGPPGGSRSKVGLVIAVAAVAAAVGVAIVAGPRFLGASAGGGGGDPGPTTSGVAAASGSAPTVSVPIVTSPGSGAPTTSSSPSSVTPEPGKGGRGAPSSSGGRGPTSKGAEPAGGVNASAPASSGAGAGPGGLGGPGNGAPGGASSGSAGAGSEPGSSGGAGAGAPGSGPGPGGAVEPTGPAAVPASAPAPAPAPAPAAHAPAFNAATCKATLGTARGSGATNAKDLTLNGTAAAWTACAQRSLKERPGGPISSVVHLMFSDTRAFRSATCTSCPPPIASCIASSTKGTVSVNFRGGDVTGDPVFDVPLTIVCD